MPFHINRLTSSKQYFNIKYSFAILTMILVLINSIGLVKQTMKIVTQRKLIPFYFSGVKFSGLENIFRNIPYAGYYTDKDMSLKQNAAQIQEKYALLGNGSRDEARRKRLDLLSRAIEGQRTCRIYYLGDSEARTIRPNFYSSARPCRLIGRR